MSRGDHRGDGFTHTVPRLKIPHLTRRDPWDRRRNRRAIMITLCYVAGGTATIVGLNVHRPWNGICAGLTLALWSLSLAWGGRR